MNFLDDHYDLELIYPERHDLILKKAAPDGLLKYQLFRGHFCYDTVKALPINPIFVTMLRDPVARVLSFWRHCRQTAPDTMERTLKFPIIDTVHRLHHEKATTLDLERFVCDDQLSSAINNAQTYQLAAHIGLPRTQHIGACLAQAKEHLEQFAFVGVMERFDDSVRMLAHQFGWRPPGATQALNRSAHPASLDEYSQSAIDAIRERNQADVALYDFAQELFHERYQRIIQADLESHYVTAWKKRHQDRYSALRLSFDKAIDGVGWHSREWHTDEQFRKDYPHIWRWTGPGTESSLDLPLRQDQDLMLRVSVLNAMSPEVRNSLSIDVNGHPLPIIPGHIDDRGVAFAGLIDKRALQDRRGPARLTFNVSETIPLNAELGDGRLCGVAVTQICIKAASERAEITESPQRILVKGHSRGRWLGGLQRLRRCFLGPRRPAMAGPKHNLGAELKSSICRQADFELVLYRFWCTQLNELPRYHRKQWEFVYICHALWQRGFLKPGMRGLGFGVGREPLAALFATYGCQVLATDMTHEDAKMRGWMDTNQHAGAGDLLNERAICPPDVFAQRVQFETVDMNDIPPHLRDFDFCWSACALEHLGSIKHGLRFIKRALDCLRPGGIAVHTTEFNVSSNSRTLDGSETVLFRRRDLEDLSETLECEGHVLEPLDLEPGEGPVDNYIDVPPYLPEPHLKLLCARFVTTSVGLIVHKGTKCSVLYF